MYLVGLGIHDRCPAEGQRHVLVKCLCPLLPGERERERERASERERAERKSNIRTNRYSAAMPHFAHKHCTHPARTLHTACTHMGTKTPAIPHLQFGLQYPGQLLRRQVLARHCILLLLALICPHTILPISIIISRPGLEGIKALPRILKSQCPSIFTI